MIKSLNHTMTNIAPSTYECNIPVKITCRLTEDITFNGIDSIYILIELSDKNNTCDGMWAWKPFIGYQIIDYVEITISDNVSMYTGEDLTNAMTDKYPHGLPTGIQQMLGNYKHLTQLSDNHGPVKVFIPLPSVHKTNIYDLSSDDNFYRHRLLPEEQIIGIKVKYKKY
jgi:hypothetical protein